MITAVPKPFLIVTLLKSNVGAPRDRGRAGVNRAHLHLRIDHSVRWSALRAFIPSLIGQVVFCLSVIFVRPQSPGDALYLATLNRTWLRQSRPIRVMIAPAINGDRITLVSGVFSTPYWGSRASPSKLAARATLPTHRDEIGLTMPLVLTLNIREKRISEMC